MAWDINQVVILGRLTRDPETSYTKSNKQICKFSVANNRGKGDQPGDVHFFNVTAWEKLAGTVSQYLKKGSQCVIVGSLSQSRWTDEAGKTKSAVSITANTVQFIGGKNENQPGQAPAMTGPSEGQQQEASINAGNFDSEPLGNDEVPF